MLEFTLLEKSINRILDTQILIWDIDLFIVSPNSPHEVYETCPPLPVHSTLKYHT